MTWFRFYFFDPDRPSGSQFLGACVVEGEHQMHALERSWKLGCNPGGQAEGSVVHDPPDAFTNTLLDRVRTAQLDQALDPCPF